MLNTRCRRSQSIARRIKRVSSIGHDEFDRFEACDETVGFACRYVSGLDDLKWVLDKEVEFSILDRESTTVKLSNIDIAIANLGGLIDRIFGGRSDPIVHLNKCNLLIRHYSYEKFGDHNKANWMIEYRHDTSRVMSRNNPALKSLTEEIESDGDFSEEANGEFGRILDLEYLSNYSN